MTYYFTLVLIMSAIVLPLKAQDSAVGKVGKTPDENLGRCECGVFPTQEPKVDQIPLMKNNPMNVTCPADDTCMNMCNALAQAAKATGPGLLCAQIDDIEDLYVSVFYRTCDDQGWSYSGVSRKGPICCNSKKSVPCKNDLATEQDNEMSNIADHQI